MKVGQKVFVRRVGNAARHREKDELISEEIVEKIGRKYFYLKDFYKCKFCLEDMHDVSEYTSNYYVYLTKQEILDENEQSEITDKIKTYFRKNQSDLSLEDLKKICEIIDKTK
jgi:hypothetical protein